MTSRPLAAGKPRGKKPAQAITVIILVTMAPMAVYIAFTDFSVRSFLSVGTGFSAALQAAEEAAQEGVYVGVSSIDEEAAAKAACKVMDDYTGIKLARITINQSGVVRVAVAVDLPDGRSRQITATKRVFWAASGEDEYSIGASPDRTIRSEALSEFEGCEGRTI